MRLSICGTLQSQDEIMQGLKGESDDLVFAEKWDDVTDKDRFDAFFLLDEWQGEISDLKMEKPVFLNEVVSTLTEMKAPENVIRITGWQGFLQRNTWEVAGRINGTAREAATLLGKKLIVVKDVPGLIGATVVSMIINEAFFALKEGLSTQEEINIAMKSATHYPYGPFEWGEKIGWKNIHRLLLHLSKSDERYSPSFSLSNL